MALMYTCVEARRSEIYPRRWERVDEAFTRDDEGGWLDTSRSIRLARNKYLVVKRSLSRKILIFIHTRRGAVAIGQPEKHS